MSKIYIFRRVKSLKTIYKNKVEVSTSKLLKRNFSIDIVGTCNLRCPSCPVGNIGIREEFKTTRFMDQELFEKIIDKIDKFNKIENQNEVQTPQISLHDWGEPTLHKKLPNFIKYAKGKNFIVGFSSNFNTSPDWEEIIKAKPDFIKVSISSLKKDNYKLTHRGGNLSRLLKNLNEVIKLRERYSPLTDIQMNYHIYAHNLNEEYEKVREFSKKNNLSWHGEIAIFMPIEKIVNFRQSVDTGDLKINNDDEKIISSLLISPLSQYNYWKENKKIREKFKDCSRQINKMAIRVDGSVPVCCGVYGEEFTVAKNFLEEDISDIQKKRENFKYCGVCKSTGAHASYAVGRRSIIINRLIQKRNFFGKIARKLRYRPIKFNKI